MVNPAPTDEPEPSAGRRWAVVGRRPHPAFVIFSAIAVLLLLLGRLVHYLMQPDDANFSIKAMTEVVSVEPSCALELNWVLPPGTVTVGRDLSAGLAAATQPPVVDAPGAGQLLGATPRSVGQGACQPVTGTDKPEPAKGITLKLRAGSMAVVEQLPDQRWQIQVTRSTTFERCVDLAQSGRRAIEFVVDGVRCGENDSSFTYDSAPKSKEPPQNTDQPVESVAYSPQDFAYVLEGRVVMGAPLRDASGGWGPDSASALRGAVVSARSKAFFTGQSTSMLDEVVDMGSVIDSSPRESSDERRASARGFARAHKEGGLEVLAYVTGKHIAITPHAGDQRKVQVANWVTLINSAFYQVLAAVLAVAVAFGAILQGVVALFDLANGTKRPAKARTR